jgi:pimeloyl-ACP methyl ester carboxylesterase
VFALDLRNHGRSPHSDIFNYRAMAEDVNAFMESQQITSAHIIGHSMGGKAAMQFAVDYPRKVDKLIVVDIAPKTYPARHDEILDALRVVDMSTLESRSELDECLAQRIPDASVRQFLMMNAVPDGDGHLKWRINLDAIYRNYDEIGKGIEVAQPFAKPALFIKGAQSDYIHEEDAALINDIFPQSKTVTIPGAGHWVHVDAPDEFIKTVLDFLNE